MEPKYTQDQLESDDISKKDLVTYLQDIASIEFQVEFKLKGQVKNVAKTNSKEALIASFNALFERKSFKQEGDDKKEDVRREKELEALAAKTAQLTTKDEVEVESGPPKFKKITQKKGNKLNFPRAGDTVQCYYTGKFENGKVFDTNAEMRSGQKKHKNQPLKFKVGTGQVILGWDQGVQKMSLGECAQLTIEPAGAYGRRGVDGKIPPNSTLIFDIELVSIE